MPKTQHLLREEITYPGARNKEINVLHKLRYYEQQNRFFSAVNDERDWMKAIVAHRLGLDSPNACRIADRDEWLNGTFNLCVLVTIENWKRRPQSGKLLILHFPLPYHVGEAFWPENADEKIRCEAGTYAWLQQNCLDVPIPRLYGFATATGKMLPVEWFTQQGDNSTRRKNFFRDYSCIMLSVSRIPLPVIGSFIIDSNAMRATFPTFFRRELRRGSFVFALTDLHQSNVLIDKDRHITSIVDLEWGSAVMEQAWKRRTFWYSLALTSPTGLLALFYNHIQPLLTVKATAHETFHEIMPWYWKLEIFQILRRKVLDKKDYDAQLRQAFDNGDNGNSKGKGKENPQIDTT
ncbi:uncharacterized protein ASPGLDRAFT_66777 [Aspergillus glaucus CBS 516.65]|uniref:Aminoglycoside phosphotransferase domain-containing protein n=1 Tax=Aspergillus glaucus CBS 516.65 TaxID=1160497 RepID=A0A1L9VIS8_ASPGL|nr:hypothetical protein ASPGLDRAFT_66777 [Aspergillus glaucus CBS 516.65]OJJ83831.1 hypothetical protein ASPGLDRAFT_66777 [Aspergillus glaucus CBS 516.65]